MKRLMSFIRKIQSRLTINLNKRPLLFTILMLVFLNLVLLLISAWIAAALDSAAYPSYGDAFIRTAAWLVIPNSVLNVTNNKVMVLAVFVAVTGIVLFSGTIIAMTTNYLRSYMADRTEARGKLILSGHYVILNYNDKVPAILTDFMFSGAKNTVVVLSDKGKDYVKNALLAELAQLKQKPDSKLSLIIRKGTPSFLNDLNDISISTAAGVLIMQSERPSDIVGGINTNDINTVKLLMTVAETSFENNCPIIVETESAEAKEMVEQMISTLNNLEGKNIEVFSYNRRLGQFLAMAVLCPDITGVLYDLMSFKDCEFYCFQDANAESRLYNYTDSIPVAHGNKTYVLARGIDKTAVKRREPYICRRRVQPPKEAADMSMSIYIIGENNKSTYMLEALKNSRYGEFLNIYTFPSEDRYGFLQSLDKGTGAKIAVVVSDSENYKDDANVFLTLIDISRKYGSSRPFKVVAEITDPKNLANIEKFNVKDIIVSNRIISYLAAQMLTKSSTARFYEDIFAYAEDTNGRFDIRVDRAGYLFNTFADAQFSSYAEFVHSLYHSSEKRILPLGYTENGKNIYFCDGLDERREFNVLPNTKIIYVESEEGSSLRMASGGQRRTAKMCKERFSELYKKQPAFTVSAPGRVNIIGEHIDYCGGMVLPCALSLRCDVYAAFNGTDTVNIAFTTTKRRESFSLNKPDSYKSLQYSLSQAGVFYILKREGIKTAGMDILYDCAVPFGAGLSSSAAIGVATAFLILKASGLGADLLKAVLTAQRAEHEYAGVKCGIMDQYVSAFGKKGNALLLDCSAPSHRYIPVKLKDYEFIIADCNKPHALVQSQYNRRREECAAALEFINGAGISAPQLTGVKAEQLERLKAVMPETLFRRARHIISENDRVRRAAEAMERGDAATLGTLMNQSHFSLKDDYEVTGAELDALCAAARQFKHCIGSRMTGAGFGGSTISLVKKGFAHEFKTEVAKAYADISGYQAAFYQFEIDDGVKVL